MTRTTVEKVKAIIEVPVALTDAMITASIADAALLVTEALSGKGISEGRLELIERYMTAHLVTLLTERGGLLSSEVDDVRDTYAGPKNGVGLAMTRYGQQAIAFDPSGTLKAMAIDPTKSGMNAQFRVL
ncbi:hypothetical protein MAINES_00550 [Brevundimonas phage vB_BpoS-MaInes]|nr:hypothetical protein MAINES_00550 [Brevundimonas phage vB_BpoS-MaInes]